MKKEFGKSDEGSDEEDTYVNPHYKCSVKRDEIPEVPMNRFLMRGPTKLARKRKENLAEKEPEEAAEAPFEVDLSKFEDVPEDTQTLKTTDTALKSRVKPTESVVSRSGRVMKGRGTFKFRTPSPQERQYHSNSRRRHSPPSRRYSHVSRHLSRYSRSRSRSRTPPRKYSRRDDNTRHRTRDKDRETHRRRDTSKFR